MIYLIIQKTIIKIIVNLHLECCFAGDLSILVV